MLFSAEVLAPPAAPAPALLLQSSFILLVLLLVLPQLPTSTMTPCDRHDQNKSQLILSKVVLGQGKAIPEVPNIVQQTN